MWTAKLGAFFLLLVWAGLAPAQEVDVLHEDKDGRYGWAYNDFKSFHSFTFNYTAKDNTFSEDITLTFDAFIRRGGKNGYRILANNRIVATIAEFTGTGSPEPQSTNLTGRLSNGENTIRIESTTNLPNQELNWGLSNINVERVATALTQPDLIIQNIGLISDNLQANQPFGVVTEVANIGLRDSAATELTFYLSEDNNITKDDMSIGDAEVGVIGDNEDSSISQEITLTSFDNNLYFGACVAAVALETNTSNNCSQAIKFRKAVITGHLLPLLLDDDK